MMVRPLLAGLVLLSSQPLVAEVESELSSSPDQIPLGIEAVTGLRSNYLHRGFELAEMALDFQFATEVVLGDHLSLGAGLAHLAESDGDFSESSIYLEPTIEWSKNLKFGATFNYRDRDASLLEGGFDLGIFVVTRLDLDLYWRNELFRDFGVDGWYFSSQLQWSKPVSESAFVAVDFGVSAVSDYHDRDGMNDLFGRIAFTYALSDQISFTPFAGFSLLLDDHAHGSDQGYAGFWFEVLF